MNLEQAYFIAYLQTGPIRTSARALSEKVHEKYPDLVPVELAGNQIEGMDLAKDAFETIYGMNYIDAARTGDKRLQYIAEIWINQGYPLE